MQENVKDISEKLMVFHKNTKINVMLFTNINTKDTKLKYNTFDHFLLPQLMLTCTKYYYVGSYLLSFQFIFLQKAAVHILEVWERDFYWNARSGAPWTY